MHSPFELAESAPADWIGFVRKGLNPRSLDVVADTLGISKNVLTSKLKIARRTLTRKSKENQSLDAMASEKVLRLAHIRNLAATLFTTDEAIAGWLGTPDAALNGAAPLDILDTDIGAREVENLLTALAYGHYV